MYEERRSGHAAVAALAGCSLETAIKAVGKKGRTTAAVLGRGLDTLGYRLCPRIALSVPGGVPDVPLMAAGFLALVHWPDDPKRTHWDVILHGPHILDPAYGPDPAWPDDTRITSIWQVYPK